CCRVRRWLSGRAPSGDSRAAWGRLSRRGGPSAFCRWRGRGPGACRRSRGRRYGRSPHPTDSRSRGPHGPRRTQVAELRPVTALSKCTSYAVISFLPHPADLDDQPLPELGEELLARDVIRVAEL